MFTTFFTCAKTGYAAFGRLAVTEIKTDREISMVSFSSISVENIPDYALGFLYYDVIIEKWFQNMSLN